MKTNIKTLPDKKLIELCAEAQGWEYGYTRTPSWKTENNQHVAATEYNPLADSIQGKAQAMELLQSHWHEFVAYMQDEFGCMWIHKHISDDLQRYAVLAVVASKYGNTIEYDGGEG